MQLILKPTLVLKDHEIAFFDTSKEAFVSNSTLTETLKLNLRNARAFMGQDSFLNPIRGKHANGNYYLTCLRYLFYGYSNSQDMRYFYQHFIAATQTTANKTRGPWTSYAATDGTVVTSAYRYNNGYNAMVPFPTDFSQRGLTVTMSWPQANFYNSLSVSVSLTYLQLYSYLIRPPTYNNQTLVYAYNSQTPMTIKEGRTSDYLTPTATVSINPDVEYINALGETDFRSAQTGYVSARDSRNDGLHYLKDASGTYIADLPTETVDIDLGLIYIDDNNLMKLNKSDWSALAPVVPGSRPQLNLQLNRTIDL